MKLYIVDRDDSGFGTADYAIMGIFSTKQKADDFIKSIDNFDKKYLYEITETKLDKPGEEMLGLSVFMTE